MVKRETRGIIIIEVDGQDLAMVLSGGLLSGWCFGLSLAVIPKNDN
ncbi:MAG: hypothetical protein AAB823_01045 [Patescibacteria group bacterium]